MSLLEPGPLSRGMVMKLSTGEAADSLRWRKRLYGRYDVRLFFHPLTGSLTVIYG